MALLTLRDVTLSFGGPRLLDNATLSLERGDRLCLLGRNGEGKSTLLKLIDGSLQPDEGQILRQQGLKVARLPQEVPTDVTGTLADEIARGLQEHGIPADSHDYRVLAILSRIGLEPELRFEELSSGMKRRALLARSLVTDPDILLLDEPTNHLDIESIRWLEEFLVRYSGTLVFVTHDRVFLDRLATRIVELDRGHLYDFNSDYKTFLKHREEQAAAEARENALFDKKLAQEEVWIRKGIQARRTRNEGRVRALKALREARQKRREKQGTARIVVQEGERSGAMVIEAKGVGFSYGGKQVLKGVNTTIMRGDKVGIVGPNGAGKTTLLQILLGRLAPTQGTVRNGTNLEIAYFDQLKAVLDEEKTVQQNVSDGYDTIPINGQPRHVIGYLQDFLFAPERSRTQVKFLSGGERSRLLLARLFTKPCNILVLDEPTNDLDVETLELLESLLVDFGGTALLVSHDRAFLNNVVTATLAIDPDGEVKEYDGGYDDYLRQRSVKPVQEPGAKKADTAEPASSSASSAGPPERARKLSFKEKKELELLPTRIEELEAAIEAMHNAMADPGYYKRPGTELAVDRAKMEALEAELATAFERWELLS